MDISQKILSDITVFNKYAKFQGELGRRETWEEICGRNKAMHVKRYPAMETELDQVYESIIAKQSLPSMRAIENSTHIITKEGWKLVGEVLEGDVLYSSSGEETVVKSVVKFSDKLLYKITFSDYSEITACDEHLWIIATTDDIKTKTTRVVDTLFIKDHVKQGSKNNITVYNPEPIKREHKELKVDPYLLGHWLGDGYSVGYQISCDEKDSAFIISEYEKAGFSTKQSESSNVWTWYVHGLKTYLDQYNLTNNKHIPDEFLLGSIEQRLSLVQGLMDSDGHITTEGRCQFSNTNEYILSGMKELLSSLGIKWTVAEGKQKEAHHKPIWTISFFTSLQVARLPRKKKNIRVTNSSRNLSRKVISVEQVPNGSASCFHVDSLDNSFLVGKQMIVTHNSMQFGGMPIELSNNRIYNCAYMACNNIAVFSEAMFLLLGGTGLGYSVQLHHVAKLPVVKGPIERNRRFLIGDSIEGWADAIKVLIKAHLLGKSTPVFDYRDIRDKGAPLITSGGKAPGPDPLRVCINQVRAILNNAKGRKLSPVECHDIFCFIADSVLSGGIRRAALIALFSVEDLDMLACKTGNWFETDPQRGRANNSIVLHREHTSKNKFFHIWDKVKLSGAGEPGIFWTNDYELGTNPCCEISLNDMQMCNLTEINASTIYSQEELNERAKTAAFLGTIQAGYTDFHYLRDGWQDITEKEALIGVGMTGIASEGVLVLDLEEATKVVIDENERVAKLIGINPAARCTCVKPSGTSSLTVGSSSGIHAWHAEYYIRRMRLGKTEALYHYILDKFPMLIEDCVFKPHLEAVLSIPQKAPEGAILRTESYLNLLERVKKFNTEWVFGGHVEGANYHNVSCTISLKENEWDACGKWMWHNKKFYTGIAVLPYDGGNYVQAPFEECTQEKYEELMGYLKDIDLTQVLEEVDNTDLKDQVACAGGVCER